MAVARGMRLRARAARGSTPGPGAAGHGTESRCGCRRAAEHANDCVVECVATNEECASLYAEMFAVGLEATPPTYTHRPQTM